MKMRLPENSPSQVKKNSFNDQLVMIRHDRCSDWAVWYMRFESKNRIWVFSFLNSRVCCGATLSEKMDSGRAYARDSFDKVPLGHWGRREVWKFSPEFGQMLFSGSLSSENTVVSVFVEWSEVGFGQVCLPGREVTLFEGNSLPTKLNISGVIWSVW